MKVVRFEDLIAWQKAQDLAVCIYKLFKTVKDFSFRDQICRAVVAISNNIAEGFERGTDKDFSRFLDIARSSCSEVRSMLYLAFRLEYISSEQQYKLLNLSNEISRLIYGLQRALFKHSSITND